ncbi:zf-TFIIB domain-containing protein [Allosphingosinicella flava]|uniref:Zf-TFIIB domain-containing protein n=1 Tax=Allosphingosinicella flava TaxID=2771430 RepID=A0A7T2GK04_9SPHN|nr:zf-TFIIB domain-containing protein [Sphingosinicella flava]QPQ55275.1 zf-TFIIB domain-containing protein [Sphingosinicella flava]
MPNPAVGMPCPVCQVPLVMSERQGVEIDYCPQCRGVWLDRGELDKIIERSQENTAPAAPAQHQPQPAPSYQQPYGYGHGHQGHHGHYKKRRKSFLEELFD